jgi:hypothetical protein
VHLTPVGSATTGCDVCAEVLVSHEMAWSDQRGQGSVRDWASSTIRRSLTRGGKTRTAACLEGSTEAPLDM